MLQLQGELLVELIELPLRGEVLDGGADEALGDLERGFDLNPSGGAGVEDRHRTTGDRGEKVDGAHGDEKLGADWPVIPEPLQERASHPYVVHAFDHRPERAGPRMLSPEFIVPALWVSCFMVDVPSFGRADPAN